MAWQRLESANQSGGISPGITEKNKDAVTIARRDAFIFYSPPGPPKPAEKSGGSRMYTFEPPILYSEDNLRGLPSGQHPISFRFTFGVYTPGAIRFLLWWLFLHRRLRSRQRGSQSFDASG